MNTQTQPHTLTHTYRNTQTDKRTCLVNAFLCWRADYPFFTLILDTLCVCVCSQYLCLGLHNILNQRYLSPAYNLCLFVWWLDLNTCTFLAEETRELKVQPLCKDKMTGIHFLWHILSNFLLPHPAFLFLSLLKGLFQCFLALSRVVKSCLGSLCGSRSQEAIFPEKAKSFDHLSLNVSQLDMPVWASAGPLVILKPIFFPLPSSEIVILTSVGPSLSQL